MMWVQHITSFLFFKQNAQRNSSITCLNNRISVIWQQTAVKPVNTNVIRWLSLSAEENHTYPSITYIKHSWVPSFKMWWFCAFFYFRTFSMKCSKLSISWCISKVKISVSMCVFTFLLIFCSICTVMQTEIGRWVTKAKVGFVLDCVTSDMLQWTMWSAVRILSCCCS